MYKRLVNIPQKQSFFLLGARQTGKTTLIKQLVKETKAGARYINLAQEDEYFKYIKDPAQLRREFEHDIKAGTVKEVYLDEIQRVPALLNEVQALSDQFPIRFILTGSSARKLKRGAANLLGGRAVMRFLAPLTALELGPAFQLDRTLRFGSLPRIYQADSDDERRDLLTGYTRLYLKEEIQAEGLVRNLPAFSRFLDVAAQQSGELLNYAAIGADVGLPGRTVQSYYEILEDTLIAFRLPPYTRSVRRRLRGHAKVYLFDVGVVNALQQLLGVKASPLLRGRRFEHFIVLETQRVLAYSRAELSLHFWRTKDDQEVDLVFTRGDEPVLACEIKSASKITGLALKGLKAFHDEHPRTPRIIVAPVDRSFSLEGVEVLTVMDYLQRIHAMS